MARSAGCDAARPGCEWPCVGEPDRVEVAEAGALGWALILALALLLLLPKKREVRLGILPLACDDGACATARGSSGPRLKSVRSDRELLRGIGGGVSGSGCRRCEQCTRCDAKRQDGPESRRPSCSADESRWWPELG